MALNLKSTINKISKERARLLNHADTLTKGLENLQAAVGKGYEKGRANPAIARAQKKRWREWRAK